MPEAFFCAEAEIIYVVDSKKKQEIQ